MSGNLMNPQLHHTHSASSIHNNNQTAFGNVPLDSNVYYAGYTHNGGNQINGFQHNQHVNNHGANFGSGNITNTAVSLNINN